jgi:hypothetical protein
LKFNGPPSFIGKAKRAGIEGGGGGDSAEETFGLTQDPVLSDDEGNATVSTTI